MDAQEFIQKDYSYAVVGATINPHKYGYTVLKDLYDAGFHAVGINPKYQNIDGIQVYPTFQDVPGNVDVAVFVVPPDVGLLVLPQVEEKGIKKIWLQPGAESDALKQAIQEAGVEMNPVGSCIMVVRRQLKG